MSITLLKETNTEQVYNDWVTLTLKSPENLQKTTQIIKKHFKVNICENLGQAKKEESAAKKKESIEEVPVIHFLYQNPKIKQPKYCFWFYGKLAGKLLAKLKEKEINFSQLGVNISRIDIKKKIIIPMNRDDIKKEIQIIAKEQRKIEKTRIKIRDVRVGGLDESKVSIGERTDETFNRLYADEKGDFSFEIELKGKATKKMAHAIENENWDELRKQEIKTYEKQAKKLATTNVTAFFKNNSQETESKFLSKKKKKKDKLKNEKVDQKIKKSHKRVVPFCTPFQWSNYVYFNPVIFEVFKHTFDANAVFLAWVLIECVICKEMPPKSKTILNILAKWPFKLWVSNVQKEKVDDILTLEISRKEICEKLSIRERSENYKLIINLLKTLQGIEYVRHFKLESKNIIIPRQGRIIENIQGLFEKGKNPTYKIKFGPMILSYAHPGQVSYEKGTIEKILKFFKTFCFKGRQSIFLVVLTLFILSNKFYFYDQELIELRDFFPLIKRDKRVYQVVSFYLTKFLNFRGFWEFKIRNLNKEEERDLKDYIKIWKEWIPIDIRKPCLVDKLFFNNYDEMIEFKKQKGFIDTWPRF